MRAFTLDVAKTAGSTEDVAVYQLAGKLSLETVAGFIPQLRAETARHLILGMSGARLLDSVGAGALVSLFVSRRNRGRTFALAALPPQAMAVVTVAGLQKLLPVETSVEQATGANPESQS